MGEYAALGLFGALNLIAFGIWLGLKRRSRPESTPESVGPLDCDAHVPAPTPAASPPFFSVVLLVILLEIALFLLLPWAVAFRSLGSTAPWVALPVLAALGSGLAYAWLQGGFEWE